MPEELWQCRVFYANFVPYSGRAEANQIMDFGRFQAVSLPAESLP